MANSKVTLAQLRTSASRFGRAYVYEWRDFSAPETWGVVLRGDASRLEVRGQSKMKARRGMLTLLAALPDGLVLP